MGSSEYRRDVASPADRVPIGASKSDSPWLKKGLALNMETGESEFLLDNRLQSRSLICTTPSFLQVEQAAFRRVIFKWSSFLFLNDYAQAAGKFIPYGHWRECVLLQGGL